MYCFYHALSELGLAEGMLLKMTDPVLIPIIAFLWLPEVPGRLLIVAVDAPTRTRLPWPARSRFVALLAGKC